MSNSIFLTVSTNEYGELYVHDQDGRMVDGVFAITTSVDIETLRTAEVKFYCKNSTGEKKMDDTRLVFEDWAVATDLDITCYIDNGEVGDYRDVVTQTAWLAYQEAKK